MNIFLRFLCSPYLMVKDLYESTKYTKMQLKLINIILKNGVNDLKKQNFSFKEGREEYTKIHNTKSFLSKKKINDNVFFARMVALFLSLYSMWALWYLDIFGVLFVVFSYYTFIVLVLQYELWMNHYKCLISFSLYIKQTFKDKTLWLWYINNKYRE